MYIYYYIIRDNTYYDFGSNMYSRLNLTEGVFTPYVPETNVQLH